MRNNSVKWHFQLVDFIASQKHYDFFVFSFSLSDLQNNFFRFREAQNVNFRCNLKIEICKNATFLARSCKKEVKIKKL